MFVKMDWCHYIRYAKSEKNKNQKQLKNIFATKNEKTINIIKTMPKVNKIVREVYLNWIFMGEPSHSFVNQSLPGIFFIPFCVSLVFVARSFQTEFTFEINFPLFSKLYLTYFHTLLFPLCSRNNSPKDYWNFFNDNFW